MTQEREEDSLGPAEEEVLTGILDELRKHVVREARKLSAGEQIDPTAIVRACAELGLPAGEPEVAPGGVHDATAAPHRDMSHGDMAELLQRLAPGGRSLATLATRGATSLESEPAPPYTLQAVLGLVLARLTSGNAHAPGHEVSLPHWGSALCPRCMTLLAIRKPNVPPRRRWPS